MQQNGQKRKMDDHPSIYMDCDDNINIWSLKKENQ